MDRCERVIGDRGNKGWRSLRISAALLGFLLTTTGTDASEPFEALSFEAALARAAKVDRPVFLFFEAPWVPQAARGVWYQPEILQMLQQRTVAIQLDIVRDEELARRFRIETVPALLLVGADGRERDYIVKPASVPELIAELRDALDGIDGIARAQRRLGGLNRKNPFRREELAYALDRQGRAEDALREYLVCLDDGLDNTFYAAARRDWLAQAIWRLGTTHEPAREALRTRQEQWERSLREDRDDVNVARNVAALHRGMDAPERTLELFDRLPQESKARRVVFDYVVAELITARRYADVVAMVDPQKHFDEQVRKARGGIACPCCSVSSIDQYGVEGAVAQHGARLVETLAALGRDAEARALLAAVREFRPGEVTEGKLRTHLERAGRIELLAGPSESQEG